MKIIHIESGLGNQMLSYCEYLAIKKANPNDECYIETIIFDIPECNEVICQWNGYELDRIFNISAPNIKEKFTSSQWNSIIQSIRESKFWNNDWNYPPAFTEAFNANGCDLVNIRGDLKSTKEKNYLKRGIVAKFRSWFNNHTWLGVTIKRIITQRHIDYSPNPSIINKLFIKSTANVFAGQQLLFNHVGAGVELLKSEISIAFQFPPFNDNKNKDYAHYLETINAVFIHARRGDMLSRNGWCYKYGYFKRAVKYIKRHVENPVFVFFTDPGSIQWCMENEKIFGLSFAKDKIEFVDWNKGNDSFRDMQLMSYCKHGITTYSSFGWWGAYFIKNPKKITVSPLAYLNTTHHC